MNGIDARDADAGDADGRGDGGARIARAGRSSTGCSSIGMIKHHQGAIDMVDVLFKSCGAAQDETVFKFASDVYADQSIEIRVMNEMLGNHQ
mgnify:CR=1 FL=1